MIPKELLAQVRRIEILTGRLVAENFAGEYLSLFKGRGMEFAEVREYVPGDDIRAIDWNVTARTGRPFMRIYAEERELTVIIACDLSGSQDFGTGTRLKKEIAAELSAVLAFSALQNGDKVGLFLITEGIEEFVPPRKGRRHVLHMIRDVLAYEPKKRGTRLAEALDRINRVMRRRSVVFLISDFRDEGFDKALRVASHKHDLIPVVITDPRELELPPGGAGLELVEPEAGRRSSVVADRASVAAHARAEQAREAALDRLFKLCGVVPIKVSTGKPYIDPIIRFFRERSMRLRH